MRRARLLVVDDEPGMVRAVARVLGGRHEVLTAATPKEALALAERLPPDIAILDLRMPEMSGFELTQRLKRAVPGIDVILMTGSVSELDAKLVRAIREQAFYFIQKPFDREVLETLVDRCLDLRRLEEAERRHTRRLEAELLAARAFQRSLLPRASARIGGTLLEGRSEACVELGGDVFDYADAGPGAGAARPLAAFLVADVSGHGASAAMLTGIVKGGFQAARDDGFEPVSVLERIAASLSTLPARTFVTVFCGRVDRSAGTLEYASAGHPAALLARAAGGIERIPSTGRIVSPAIPPLPRALTTAFGPRDRLLVYTDGIVEAGPEEDPFGEERLAELLAAGAEADGKTLLEGILEAVRAHGRGRPLSDDCTLLAVTAE